MSYGPYGGGGAKRHCKTMSKVNVLELERGFFPISPAPPPSTSTAATSFNTAANSLGGSLRQKRKAFAIGVVGVGSGGGTLNEFSMSDVIVEPVTNVSNFSPQSSTNMTGPTSSATTHPELFEIERIPTVEELIQADPSNSALPTMSLSLSNCSPGSSGNEMGTSSSIATVVLVPSPPPLSNSDCDFVTQQHNLHHEST